MSWLKRTAAEVLSYLNEDTSVDAANSQMLV